MKKMRSDSALRYILEGLIPYTEANLKLAFHPNQFFNELEKKSFRKPQTLRNAYYKAQKNGLIKVDKIAKTPRITEKGMTKLQPYKAKKLQKDVQLMIIFDIPEVEKDKRQRLRLLLKQLLFKQVQKSVWVSNRDSRRYIKAEVRREMLQEHVEIYEVHRLKK